MFFYLNIFSQLIYKIPYLILNLNNKLNLTLSLNKLKENNISLICLAGYMKVLKKKFIDKYNGKIINIHPSLLPKYKGLDTFKRVLESKEKITGCTVHHVNSRMDDGDIIDQQKVIITSNDTADTLKQKVLELEHKLYPKVIKELLS